MLKKNHLLLSAALPLLFLAADKGGGSGGSAKAKVEGQTDGAITVPEGAEVINEPISPVAPETVNQPVANPNEEAKLTYRRDFVDGKPLEIKERPARLAGNIADIAGFGGETAQDRSEAHQERINLAAKAANK